MKNAYLILAISIFLTLQASCIQSIGQRNSVAMSASLGKTSIETEVQYGKEEMVGLLIAEQRNNIVLKEGSNSQLVQSTDKRVSYHQIDGFNADLYFEHYDIVWKFVAGATLDEEETFFKDKITQVESRLESTNDPWVMKVILFGVKENTVSDLRNGTSRLFLVTRDQNILIINEIDILQ